MLQITTETHSIYLLGKAKLKVLCLLLVSFGDDCLFVNLSFTFQQKIFCQYYVFQLNSAIILVNL